MQKFLPKIVALLTLLYKNCAILAESFCTLNNLHNLYSVDISPYRPNCQHSFCLLSEGKTVFHSVKNSELSELFRPAKCLKQGNLRLCLM